MRRYRAMQRGDVPEPLTCADYEATKAVVRRSYKSNYTHDLGRHFQTATHDLAFHTRIRAGTFNGTSCLVSATLVDRDDHSIEDVWVLRKMAKITGDKGFGTPRIVLVKNPVKDAVLLADQTVVPAEDLWDQGGLPGFHAGGEVVGWQEVTFLPAYRSSSFSRTYEKLLGALEKRWERCEDVFSGDPVSPTSSEERELAEDDEFFATNGARDNPIPIDSDDDGASDL